MEISARQAQMAAKKDEDQECEKDWLIRFLEFLNMVCWCCPCEVQYRSMMKQSNLDKCGDCGEYGACGNCSRHPCTVGCCCVICSGHQLASNTAGKSSNDLSNVDLGAAQYGTTPHGNVMYRAL